MAGGQVKDVAVDADGRATLAFALQPGDPGVLVRHARAAVQGVEGVSSVKVDVRLRPTRTRIRRQFHQPERRSQPVDAPEIPAVASGRITAPSGDDR